MSALIETEIVNFIDGDYEFFNIDTISLENRYIIVPQISEFSKEPQFEHNSMFIEVAIAKKNGFDIKSPIWDRINGTYLGEDTPFHPANPKIPVYLPYINIAEAGKEKRIYFRNVESCLKLIEALKEAIPEFYANSKELVKTVK